MIFSKEELLRQDIIPVIFVRGSNYEMGYQYGYQVGAGIEPVRDMIAAGIKNRIGNLDTWHRFLKGFQFYIQKYTPELIDEMIGISAGAKAAGYDITYTDIMSINAGVYVKSAPSPTAELPSPLDELPPKEYQDKYNIKADDVENISTGGAEPAGQIRSPADFGGDCSRWAAWGSATDAALRDLRIDRGRIQEVGAWRVIGG